jgi:hypothetical protein
MIDRQRYLLSRLHYRYRPAALPNDVELTAAGAHIAGGSGVPAGPAAELSEAATPAPNSQFQTRFFASHAWTGTTPCNKPRRWRWGKRWKSMGRVSRTVPLALDLPRLARDPAALKNALVRPVAGFTPGQPPPPPSPRSVPTSARSAPTRSGGCAMAPLPPSPRAWLLLLGAALSSVRRRRVSSA